MRRMARILLNTATAMSLLLFVVTLTLWGVSYRWACAWSPIIMSPSAGDPYAPQLTLISAEGRVLCKWDWVLSNGRRYDVARVDSWQFPSRDLWEYAPYPVTPRWRVAGFAFGRGGTVWAIMLPYAALALATALLPLARGTRAYAQRAARRPGLCPTCNYDLRATPTRCPECGTLPP